MKVYPCREHSAVIREIHRCIDFDLSAPKKRCAPCNEIWKRLRSRSKTLYLLTTIDCPDPIALASFYAKLSGFEMEPLGDFDPINNLVVLNCSFGQRQSSLLWVRALIAVEMKDNAASLRCKWIDETV